MTTIKISIITTFYNLEEYAKRCVDSLTSQTLQDIEIICVNDGSQDNTINILQELAQNDNRIKIIDKKNEGVSIARNTGINAASGEYIMFVDGDDYLEPNACEILYSKAIESDIDIIVFQKNIVAEKRKTRRDTYFKKYNYFPKLKDTPYYFDDNMNETCDMLFHSTYCWDKLYKKSFILNNNTYFPEYLNNGEDCIFLGLCLKANPKILLTDYYFYNYFISTKNSLSKNDRYLLFTNHIKAISLLPKLFDKNKKTDKFVYLNAFHYLSNIILRCGADLYLSSNQKNYLDGVKICLKIYKEFEKEVYKNTNLYKKIKNVLFLDKYHLLKIYWIARSIKQQYIIPFYHFLIR